MQAALTLLIQHEPDLSLSGLAASAEEAIRNRAWDGCDLLLTDVTLPGLSGIALAERARAERPDVPVVVVSATTEPATVARAEAAGARAYLSKAGLVDTLAPTLRAVLCPPPENAREPENGGERPPALGGAPSGSPVVGS